MQVARKSCNGTVRSQMVQHYEVMRDLEESVYIASSIEPPTGDSRSSGRILLARYS